MTVKSSVDELSKKFDKVSDKIETLGQRIAALKGTLKKSSP